MLGKRNDGTYPGVSETLVFRSGVHGRVAALVAAEPIPETGDTHTRQINAVKSRAPSAQSDPWSFRSCRGTGHEAAKTSADADTFEF